MAVTLPAIGAEPKPKPKTISGDKFIADTLVPFTDAWLDADQNGTTEQRKVARVALLKTTQAAVKKMTVKFRATIQDVSASPVGTGYEITYSDLQGEEEVLGGPHGWNSLGKLSWHPKSSAQARAVNPGDTVEITGTPGIGPDTPAAATKRGTAEKIPIMHTLGLFLWVEGAAISIVPAAKDAPE